jgi:AcrR family transcriptional regulator
MPKLWDATIDAHRRVVRDATLDATAALVADNGLRSVTMSQIAEQTGIARATLYKYFPDVEAILVAWHERHITAHLEHLEHLAEQPFGPGARLAAVLEAFALMRHEHRNSELAPLLHQAQHVETARRQLIRFLRSLIAEAAATREARDDVPPDELAEYCLHALAAATVLPSKASVRRLVAVVLDGLRPPR